MKEVGSFFSMAMIILVFLSFISGWMMARDVYTNLETRVVANALEQMPAKKKQILMEVLVGYAHR